MVEGETGNEPGVRDILERHQRGIAVLSFEYVIEPATQIVAGLAAGIAWQRVAAIVAHDAQIIDAVAVIGMVMRPEDRIHLADPVRQQLRAQVGRGVDQDPLSRLVLDDDRNARTPVARFVRVAFAPVVADPRHAGRRAGAEHEQLHAAALLNRR